MRVFIAVHFKHWLSSTLRDLDCSFQQSLTRGIMARKKSHKSIIELFEHLFGKIWHSIFRLRPFLPSSQPLSAVFCPLLLIFCSFHNNMVCRIHFRCLVDKSCKYQNTTNKSSETAFCGAMTVSLTQSAIPGSWVMRCGIKFPKAFRLRRY